MDIMGRTVRHLVDENQESGSYSRFWDGKGDRGRMLPRGNYLLMLRIGESVQTQKVQWLGQ